MEGVGVVGLVIIGFIKKGGWGMYVLSIGRMGVGGGSPTGGGEPPGDPPGVVTVIKDFDTGPPQVGAGSMHWVDSKAV